MATQDEVSLREYLTHRLDALEVAVERRFVTMERAVDLAAMTSERAREKAESALERRFEAINGFREALSDQTASFVTRQTMEAVADKLGVQIERNRDDLDELSKRVVLRDGVSQGSRLTWGAVAALVAAGGTLITTIAILAAYLSSH